MTTRQDYDRAIHARRHHSKQLTKDERALLDRVVMDWATSPHLPWEGCANIPDLERARAIFKRLGIR